MANFNKVILAGNLTRDPQLSYLPSQTPVVDFGMAINRRWRGQDGEQKDETCFVDCRAFGRQAETINQYLSKGRPILVEGRLRFSSWEKEGQKRSKLSVTVERFEFLGSSQGGGQSAPRQAPPAPEQQAPPAPERQAPPAPEQQAPPQPQPPQDFSQEPPPPQFDDGVDSIPF